MGKRGPQPGFNAKKRISEVWSPGLAYAIGLLATDGCLASRVTLIDLTSKDREQLENFNKCVGVDFRITSKTNQHGLCLRIQFKSVLFYKFLLSLGLTPAKSKTLGALKIPDEFFFHFLRGVFDGDGCTYSYWDKRWRSSFMFYVAFATASKAFAAWLQSAIKRHLSITGHVSGRRKNMLYQLRYAKKDGLILLRRMYQNSSNGMYLSRKRLKINEMLAIVGKQL